MIPLLRTSENCCKITIMAIYFFIINSQILYALIEGDNSGIMFWKIWGRLWLQYSLLYYFSLVLVSVFMQYLLLTTYLLPCVPIIFFCCQRIFNEYVILSNSKHCDITLFSLEGFEVTAKTLLSWWIPSSGIRKWPPFLRSFRTSGYSRKCCSE